jgi:glycosyltransferase involved in cell wall biosynthesis
MFRNMMPFDRSVVAKLPFGWQKLRNLLLRRAMLDSMRSADLTIFISGHARALIERLAPIPKAVTIPHGISDSFRTHDRDVPRPNWLPSGEYLLYVSRFDVYKHQREVALAYCMLAPELRDRYSLVFVGEVSPRQAEQIRRLAEAGDAANRVYVAGAVPHGDLPGAYRHAAVNVFASSCENCPNILLEALGAGRPVVASRVMPMPEFGADAVEYFDPAEPASICDAVTRVLTSEARYRQLSALAARRSDDFDWAASADETWRQISKLVER